MFLITRLLTGSGRRAAHARGAVAAKAGSVGRDDWFALTPAQMLARRVEVRVLVRRFSAAGFAQGLPVGRPQPGRTDWLRLSGHGRRAKPGKSQRQVAVAHHRSSAKIWGRSKAAQGRVAGAGETGGAGATGAAGRARGASTRRAGAGRAVLGGTRFGALTCLVGASRGAVLGFIGREARTAAAAGRATLGLADRGARTASGPGRTVLGLAGRGARTASAAGRVTLGLVGRGARMAAGAGRVVLGKAFLGATATLFLSALSGAGRPRGAGSGRTGGGSFT